MAELIDRDYSAAVSRTRRARTSAACSAPERSLGSVIKLLTPDEHDYTPEYNAWLASVPQYVKELVFVVKRYYKPEWGGDWREHFSVDIINGTPGNELKCDNRKLVTTYLRVGFDADGSWRTFGLRKDFHPAVKMQMEDDITASMVVPPGALENLPGMARTRSVAQVRAELRAAAVPAAGRRDSSRLRQADGKGFRAAGQFLFQLRAAHAGGGARNGRGRHRLLPVHRADAGTRSAKCAETGQPELFRVAPRNPRLVDGKPTKNPRYLQKRPDLVHAARNLSGGNGRAPAPPRAAERAAAHAGQRRAAGPPQQSARTRHPLARVFNPIHYMELPELFMEFICSMTGKSPSTTGAGSEGALTKGPFNALPPIIDLNNALVSLILTGHHGFVTAAGYVGPKVRVDHDVSLIVPEVWCRMTPEERDPQFLIANRYLEKCEDFEHAGKKVLASRLGYRINARFVHAFFGRVFNHPHAVFTEEMLQPGTAGPGHFCGRHGQHRRHAKARRQNVF